MTAQTTSPAEIESAARAEIARKAIDTAQEVAHCRARIAKLAAEENATPRSLDGEVQRLAGALAAQAVWTEITHWLANHDAKAARTFREWATDVVMHSLTYTRTDDGWSGRGNDLRRVEFDAALEAKQHVAETIVKGWTHHI